MYGALDEDQMECLKASLEQLKVMKQLADCDYKFGKTYFGNEEGSCGMESEEWSEDVLTILNGKPVSWDYTCTEEAEDLNIDLMYGEDEVGTMLVRITQDDILEYLAYQKSLGILINEIGRFNDIALDMIDTSIYLNDYVQKNMDIGTDYCLYIVTTEMSFITEHFVDGFSDLVFYCQNANRKRKELEESLRLIKEKEQQVHKKRQCRGKRRRERIKRERLYERLYTAA